MKFDKQGYIILPKKLRHALHRFPDGKMRWVTRDFDPKCLIPGYVGRNDGGNPPKPSNAREAFFKALGKRR